jgi:hypothetical protein
MVLVAYRMQACQWVDEAVLRGRLRFGRNNKQIAVFSGFLEVVIRRICLGVDDDIGVVLDMPGNLANGRNLEWKTAAGCPFCAGAHDITVHQ